jgi:ketosteroid isomerase-like protein
MALRSGCEGRSIGFCRRFVNDRRGHHFSGDCPMPSANLDLVRSICEPWERGDFGSAEWVHPEIEFVAGDGLTPGRTWKGLAGLIEGFREVLSAYDDYHTVAEEYRELDDERVLKFHHYSGHGKASGLEIGQIASKGADLFQIRDGKVIRLVIYFDRAHALADLDLTPDTGA